MKYFVRALRHPRDYQWLELRPFQRHSLVLAVAGGVYVIYGIVLANTEPTADRVASLKLALTVAPLDIWGGTWALVGILALISARWPPASKTWGYSAMTAMATCWGAFFGIAGNYPGLLVWWLVAFMWWAIAGLVNPDDVVVIPEESSWGG